MIKVKRTERGWPGHFCDVIHCMFRRNTLLEYKDIKIVVSTVGNYRPFQKRNDISVSNLAKAYEAALPHSAGGTNDAVGFNRDAETMAFYAKKKGPYWDADVSREFPFKSNWHLKGADDNEINAMHEDVVDEIIAKLEGNEIPEVKKARSYVRKLRLKNGRKK